MAENAVIDSLLVQLKTAAEDTNKVSILYQLSEQYESDEEILKYAQDALALSLNLNYKQGIANAYNNIGYVYSNGGKVKQALELFMFSLRLQEELKNKVGIAEALINISVIYNNQGLKEEAIEYNKRALKVYSDINDKAGVGSTLNNIGSMQNALGQQDSALTYCYRALKIHKEVNNKNGIVYSLFLIGSINNELGKQDTALSYYFKSLALTPETKIPHYYTGINYNKIGSVYLKQKKYSLAEKYCLQALQIGDSTGYLDMVIKASNSLSTIYEATGNYKKGLEMHILFKKASDNLRNEETQQMSLKKQIEYEFALKEAQQQVAYQNERAIAKEKEKQQAIITYAIVGGALLICIFSFSLWKRLRITKEQKKVITQKNKNITDSINYARLIQSTMLPQSEIIKPLFKDHFIFYKPKDIVSGDFYWMEKKEDKIFFAVADCTGHGVPGAFMSMIGNTLLNELINVKEMYETDVILNNLKQGIIKILNQTEKGTGQNDGMDISLCVLDKTKNTLSFSGANHILYHIHNNVLQEYQGDKQSINFERNRNEPFTRHEITIHPNDVIYLFTDGYIDQRGGVNKKRFFYKSFKTLLTSIHHLPMNEQDACLSKTLREWKGKMDQIDDILVMGVRL